MGNVHDLDYVFEQGGTEATIGQPKAFIEIAWRRYTKHSRNKAQEIQVDLPWFRGHLTIGVGGHHDAEEVRTPTAVPT